MLVACWSVKGGSGTTTVAAALALLLARRAAVAVVLADLAGDVADVLGIAERDGPGLGDWLTAGGDVPPDALARLEVPVRHGVTLLPFGTVPGGEPWARPWCPPPPPERVDLLAAALREEPRLVVADCGSAPVHPAQRVAAAADTSLLVVRPCYLALERAASVEMRPTGIVLVSEPGQRLGPIDVEEIVGAPVVADVDHHGSVAAAVDGGIAVVGVPRFLERDVSRLVDRLAREAV